MIIAQQKKKESLPEYILYMWQVEDFIRACEFDIKKITELRIAPYNASVEINKTMVDWYENLLVMMQKEQITENGHLQILQNNISELTELHFSLLHKTNDPKYRQFFMNSAQSLLEMRHKSKVAESVGDIEVALNTMYGILMLRLAKKEINKQTLQAILPISQLLAYLGKSYNAEEEKLKEA